MRAYMIQFDDKDLEKMKDYLIEQFEDFPFPRSFPVENPQLIKDQLQEFL